MAKNKKSKILAMTLCAGVMAGIYASPVMAAMKEIDGSNYYVNNGTINTGTFIGGTYNGGTFNGELLFHGNANMENLLVDGVSVNAAAANGVYGDRLTVGGTTLDFVQVNQTISNTSGINKVNGKTTVDWGLQVVNPKNNRVGFNVDYNGNVTIGKNGSLVVGKAFRVTNQGSVSAKWLDVDKTLTINGGKTSFDANGSMSVAQGRFVVDRKGNITNVGTVDGVDVSKLSTAATDISDLQNKTQNMYAGKNYTTFKGSLSTEGTIRAAGGAVELRGNWETDGTLNLRYTNGQYESLTATQLGNINNMITGEGVLENVVSINGAAVEGVGNGGLKISEVTLENGGIWAEKLNGKLIEEYVTDDEISGDLENIGGIDRKDVTGEGKPGEGTTVIEGKLSVSGDKINMFGDTGLTFEHGTMNNVDIINVSGNIGFNGSNVHFSYGSDGKTTTLGGLALTVDQIANDVSTIKDHFTVDDKGNVTISADDGSSLTVGKDGTSTGQGGQVTTDGNHTVNGDLDVDGSGQIDKDLTVGGDLEVGGSITTGNTTIDGSGMTVGNGTTIIDGKVSSTEGAFGKITSNTGTIGNATFDENGMTVGGTGGTSINHDEVRVGGDENGEGGSYMNNTDVVTGEGNSLNDTANRVGNLEQGVSELNNRVGELEDRIDKVGAMAAAIANLRTMGYDPAAPTEVAVGIGQYRDETGAALGLFHYPNRDFMLSLSVSTSGDEVMGGIGATWKFGRKSPEKVAEIKKAQAEADARRAEEAKLAKAEEMKQAAKEAKIKAQQERHAKLAAERAAQAEAAK